MGKAIKKAVKHRRPAIKIVRSERVQIRLTPEQKAQLLEIAEKHNRTVTDLITGTLLTANK
jgi:uncharacterized protein (DUF1778 family)